MPATLSPWTRLDQQFEAAERAAGANAEVRPVTVDDDILTRPASKMSTTVHNYRGHLRGKGLGRVPAPNTINGWVETLS